MRRVCQTLHMEPRATQETTFTMHAIEAAFKLRSLVVLEALLAVWPRCYPKPRNPIQPLVCFAPVFG